MNTFSQLQHRRIPDATTPAYYWRKALSNSLEQYHGCSRADSIFRLRAYIYNWMFAGLLLCVNLLILA